MVILDTNVISELRKIGSGRISPNVLAWFESVDLNDTFISCVTLAELKTGILLLRHRNDNQQADVIETWLNDWVLPNYQQRILPITAEIMMIYAPLHVPNQKSAHDALIASTAIFYDCPVVARNVSDFDGIDVEIINPFT